MRRFTLVTFALLSALALAFAGACDKGEKKTEPQAKTPTAEKKAEPVPVEKPAAKTAEKKAEPAPAVKPAAPAKVEKAEKPAAAAAPPSGLAAALLGDTSGFMAVIEKRIDTAIEQPKVNKAIDSMITGIGNNPAFGVAGDALLSALGSSPQIAAPGAKIAQALGNNPAMVAMIQDIMQKNPGLPPAQLEAKVMAHVESVFNGPAWNDGFDAAFDAFAKRKSVDDSFTRLGAAITADIDFEKTFTTFFASADSQAKIIAALTKLNGGKAPSGELVKDLLLQKIFTETRLADFFAEFFQMPEMQTEFAGALLPLLKSETFEKALVTRVAAILSDPGFEPAATTAMVVLLTGTPTKEKIQGALAPLFNLPVVERELVGLVDDIRKSEELRAPIQQAFANATRSKSFLTVLEKSFLAGL